MESYSLERGSNVEGLDEKLYHLKHMVCAKSLRPPSDNIFLVKKRGCKETLLSISNIRIIPPPH